MIARRADRFVAFTRRDAVRLTVAATVLVALLTAILAIDVLPRPAFSGSLGEPASADVYAPSAIQYVSQIATDEARQAARSAVAPQYDYTPERGQLSAAEQANALQQKVAAIDVAFATAVTPEARKAALAGAVPGLSKASSATLTALEPAEWTALRAEMVRTLNDAQRQEVRDPLLQAARAALPERLAPGIPAAERVLAGELLAPLLVANSTYDARATLAAQQRAADDVSPTVVKVSQGELVVLKGARLSTLDVEKLQQLGIYDQKLDGARIVGWALFAVLIVALLLGWVWRFRPEFWHRTNTLLLLGLLLLLAAFGLKVTAARSILPFFVPTAGVGLLLAVLLDASTAVVVAGLLGVLAAVASSSVELGVFVFLGGFAGIVAVRRGERFHHFVQAGLAMALVNVVVVTAFGLLGNHDATGTLQLGGASLAAAAGSAVVAVGSFAVLGNVFGITTAFQLLELANPSQPLLRRLLLETAGTYHHSLMVGNLGERAAEAIDADPLLVRVGAYYHDVGKLANPRAFIENQAGDRNLHDDLAPEASAALLKAHVSDGIDLGYQYHLPKAIIALIPQHHGTTLMSYFYARAQDRACAAAGARPGTPAAAAAAATVDESRFRHVGPKPQSKEAAILMLSDGVEAAVRSLASHDEAAIRAMVDRIIHERLEDGQFDECDLTLRDLERVREAFVQQLNGMYHQRIAYPQNKVVELETRRAGGGRRGA